MKRRHILVPVLTYLCVLFAASLFFPQARRAQEATPGASPNAVTAVKPRFSLSTTRTYSPKDKPRIWISYEGIDHLDFRVYRINDAVKFFKQLDDPHQIGEAEKTEFAESHQRSGPTFLERVREFKSSIYVSFKQYVRTQLQHKSRVAFNDRFRTGARQTLGEADFVRVPLLNSEQLVSKWREVLTPLANEYDSRNVPLDSQPAGVYLVEAVNGDLRAYTIAVVTDLTILTKTAPSGDVLAFAVDRRSGEPRQGLNLEIIEKGKVLVKGTTGADGLVRTRIERKAKPASQTGVREDEGEREGEGEDRDEGEDESQSLLVLGWDNKSFAISELQRYAFGWHDGDGGGEDIASYIYTDRPVYRPNQKVYFKGIVRKMAEAGYEVPWNSAEVTIEDPNNTKLLTRTISLTPQGSFTGDIAIASEAPLGAYRIVARLGESEVSDYFEVAEYKKPEFKVTVTTSKVFVSVGEGTKFTVESKYFFGAPVARAQVEYYIYRSRYWPSWWKPEDDGIGADESERDDGSGYGYGTDLVKDAEGVLDGDGKLVIDFTVPQPEAKETWDYTYRLEAMVTDSSRRTMNASGSFVGVRGNIVARADADKFVYYAGDTAKVRVRTSDYEGKPVSTRVKLKFARRTWERVEVKEDGYKRIEFEARDTDVDTGEVTTNVEGEGVYDYRVKGAGNIVIKTIVIDRAKEIESTGGYLWVADPQRWSDFSFAMRDGITLVADKASYKAGDTAKILAMLPTSGAHLLVSTELAGVLSARHVYSSGSVAMLEIPIEQRHVPNIYLSVSYVKDGEMYTGDKMLAVPARDKFLQVEITQDKNEYKPREVASYTISTRQADGSPAGGTEVSFGVVDESIYSVRPDHASDIRREFYGRRYNRVQTQYSTQYQFTGYSGAKRVNLASGRRVNQLADFKNEASQYAEATIRKDFRDTAFWTSGVITGADGKATVKVPLPDNLTTWRATARAVTGDTKVGSTRSRVLSRKDLLVRLEIPRFATEGDAVVISGIVHNYLPSDKTARVSIEVEGASLMDPPVQNISIEKQGEKRIDWRVKAAALGDARLLVKALTDTESDAVELRLPVVSGGLEETSGSAIAISEENGDRSFKLEFPTNADAHARRLRLEAAPSIAGSLFSGLDYLTTYPYGCTEQTMSSFLPNVVVARALKDVKSTSVRASSNLDTKVRRGLERLYRYQHGDGGWGWWKDDQTDAFMTAYVVDGLQRARGAGYSVRDYVIERGHQKIRQLLAEGKTEKGTGIDLEDRAYLVYALSSDTGEDSKPSNELNSLFARSKDLQPYGKALLALALNVNGESGKAAALAAELEKSAIVNDLDAHWESKRRPMLDFSVENDLEATAFGIKVLAALRPSSPVLPKLARWLTANKSRGYYWETTKKTAFAIFGLTDYLRVSKELQPDYSLEIYLNGERVVERRVTASDAASGQTFVVERKGPAAGNSNTIRVVKRGRGVVYLASTIDFFTNEETIAAKGSPELSLTRDYQRLRVSEAGGKPQWKLEPLTGKVESGDLIVSRLKVKGSRAQYLMIEDPIPAGCEQIERVGGIELGWADEKWSDWYSSREFRDRKTAVFVDYFDGDATFQYAMRVITPGDFRVAPARAELMYRPSVRTNSSNLKFSFADRK